MAKKSFDEVLVELKSKNFSSIYFLEGEESYFIDFIGDYITENALDEADKEFNQTILYGKETDMATILNNAKRFPMMADKQLVLVREAQEVKDIDKIVKVKINGKEQELSLLEEYAKNALPSTILVFCYKYKSLDKRKSLSKSLLKTSTFFTSQKIYDNKIPAWIESYCKKKKIGITPKASVLLTEYVGNDLSRIVNELDKLVINKKTGEDINDEDIRNNIGISKDYNVFELQNAIARKDVLKANQIVNHFAANEKENPMPMVMGILYSYFSKLILYHTSPDKSQSSIASLLKVNPFFVKDYEIAAKNYPPAKLIRIVSYLREYDLKSKGVDAGEIEKGELYKELIFKMLH
jgi:DNA polymerase-3 subunit delta